MKDLAELLLHGWLPRQLLKLTAALAVVLGIQNPDGFVSQGAAFLTAAITAAAEMALSRMSYNRRYERAFRGLEKFAAPWRPRADAPTVKLVGFALTLGLASLFLPACAGPGYSVDPVGGVCVARGDWRICYNPLTETGTATLPGQGGTVRLTFDKSTGVWRGQWPDGSSLTWDGHGTPQMEPALPQK